MSNIIQVRGLSKTYYLSDEVKIRALDNISIDVKRGEYMAIMGASGSGKSTLMNILGFLDAPSSGSYILDGIEGSSLTKDQKAEIRNRKIGFVFQGFNLLPRTSAIENVEMPLFYKGGITDAEARKKASELLDMVGLKGREDHHPNRLSGGEQQRVAIARALITNPAIILADEPTGNLDSKNTEDIMKLFTRLNEEMGITIIMVTHEPDVAEFAARKIVFKDGSIIIDAKTGKKPSKKSSKPIKGKRIS